MNQNSILNLMIAHHALLETLLAVFKDEFKADSVAAATALDEFKWEWEKHVFGEEKVIFKFCGGGETTLCQVVHELVAEHILIQETLNAFENNLAIKTSADIDNFHKLITEHRETEEQTLYPGLDRELDEAQKEAIIARINQIPMKKYTG
ncbi:MAG: hemerythrin domain-containing protein [Patescibacteria group bacterium]